MNDRLRMWGMAVLLLLLTVLTAFSSLLLWRLSRAVLEAEKVLSTNAASVEQIAKTGARISEQIDRIMNRIEALEGRLDEVIPDEEIESLAEEMGHLKQGLSGQGAIRTATSETAIDALLDRIGKSGLRFGYQDKEYSAFRFKTQLRIKYQTFKRTITSPADFIERVATKTINGHPYYVITEKGEKVPLDGWLRSLMDEHSDP
jgi:hypothetical protein